MTDDRRLCQQCRRPIDPPSDSTVMSAWLREAADELDKAHAVLDLAGVPRELGEGESVDCTLAARVGLLASRTDESFKP